LGHGDPELSGEIPRETGAACFWKVEIGSRVRSWERQDIWRGISVTGEAWQAGGISKQNEG